MIYTADREGKEHQQQAQGILSELKKICIQSEQLMCLVNWKELLHFIIKFGMLSYYPQFKRHFDEDREEDEGQAKLRKIMQSTARDRAEKAKGLIQKYHAESESKNLNKTKDGQDKLNDNPYLVEDPSNLGWFKIQPHQFSVEARDIVLSNFFQMN